MAAIQGIYVRGYEERAEPKKHTVYRIEIQASVRSWTMWRRYSEFVDLHTELVKSTGKAPPENLPPKHTFSWRRNVKDEAVLEERKRGLEVYLRAILSSREDCWRDSFAFKDFLGVPQVKTGEVGAPSEFTSASWLDEHMDLQARVRDIRADVNKRDALSERGDVSSAHSTNVHAKKKLVAVLNRLGSLTDGLGALASRGLSEGELQRRTDMLARLQDDCEKLSKMVSVARNPSRPGLGSGSVGGTSPAPPAARAALLGPVPDRPVARVFGEAAVKAEETEQTRPLDNQGLLQLQQVQMDQQDSHLSQLSAILVRQKQLGLAISNEISEQNELLDDLNDEVTHVGRKLTKAKKDLNRLG